VIDFPEPEAEDRLPAAERSLGARVPRGAEVDLALLAGTFKLAGGNIRNIAVAAAHQAPAEGRPLAMANLVRATEGEYRKLGRMVVESSSALPRSARQGSLSRRCRKRRSGSFRASSSARR